MPRRSSVGIDEIASPDTLAWALWRAACGKRHRPEVQALTDDVAASVEGLAEAIRAGAAPLGRYTSFTIFVPKERRILAPCFADRVVHHAMMRHMEPVLDRALVDDCFACRRGRGTLAAVHRAQHHLRRFDCYVQIDIRGYFASIDHALLMSVLGRRFKHPDLLALCRRILARAPVPVGVGLPIGALTSQHFANAYLAALDRYLLETLRVRGMVRYMDDVVWWVDGRQQARDSLAAVRHFLTQRRRLEVKPNARIGWSRQGLSFLGLRIRRGSIRLGPRRRRRYAAAVRAAESAFMRGEIDGAELQARMTAARSITAHADATAWRRALHARRPALEV